MDLQLNIKNISLTDHAFQRIQERFPNAAKDRNSAIKFVRGMLENATYIGIVADSDGNDSHMYSFNKKIILHISLDLRAVKTIYEIRNKDKTKLAFRNNIVNIYKKELRKTHRVELAMKRKLEHLIVKNEMEIASLKYRKYKSRSTNVKNECDHKIDSLQLEIMEFEDQLKELQQVKKQIAYAIASDAL